MLITLLLPALALSASAAPDALRQALDQSTALPPGVDLTAAVVERELRTLTGRSSAFACRGLERRPEWSALVDGALDDAGLPPFLAAVPLVESGYSNWGAPSSEESQSAAPGRVPGRGLWMFIAPTARQYGLQVDGQTDERLDPAKETQAAVALLSDLHDSLGSWPLALSAYNMGERAVREAMAAGESDDAWELIARGHLNPYAAQVVAAAVLLEEPGLAGCGG